MTLKTHNLDPSLETQGMVRAIAVPPAARALSKLSQIDYEEAFLVQTGPAPGRTGEQWARAILEEAPIITRSMCWWRGRLWG